MFFDWDFMTGTQSTYNYVTTFFPLWVGLATPEQAKAVMKNVGIFDHEGGLAMSDQQTGVQWDLPYGWAPNHLIAVEGMRRAGFNAEADRVSVKFLDTVQTNFKRTGTIREKYNVVTGSDEAPVLAGYHENLIGFGWTNGTFLALYHALPPEQQKKVLEGTGTARLALNAFASSTKSKNSGAPFKRSELELSTETRECVGHPAIKRERTSTESRPRQFDRWPPGGAAAGGR